jgi:DNA-binding Lrp family transcriptional regulator
MQDEKIDAYVLVRSTGPGQLAKLFAVASTDAVKVRFHTRLVGRYDALFVLEGDKLEDVQDFVLDELRAQGSLSTETLVGIIPVPMGIKRGAYIAPYLAAYVRVRARRGQALKVLAEVQEVPGVTGANVVTGAVDLLVEIASPTLNGLRDAILEMQAIDGIRSTESLLAAPSSPGSGSD